VKLSYPSKIPFKQTSLQKLVMKKKENVILQMANK